MRRLISSILFSFVFISFLSLSVSAQTCGASDTIMRISAPTNAHGELESGTGSYSAGICFSTIFGNQYTGPNSGQSTVHICTGTNKVVGLSASTNAHAGTGYTGNDVCYGDLTCQTVAGNVACPGTTREIVSLSASTNAHLENASANVYSGAGNVKVCCSTTNPRILNPTWRYYDGTQVPDSNPNALICANSYAIMSVQTTGISDGQLVNFQVIDDDGAIGDDNIGPVLAVAVINNQANITLDLTNPVILGFLNTGLSEAFEGDKLELFFEATYLNVLNTSYIVDYSNNASLCSYSNPGASIIAPVHKGIYFVNTNINFVSGCTSQAGPLQYEWTINQNGQIETRTTSQFTFTFPNAGNTNVRLKCTDLSGHFDIAESQILIVASPYTLAYIDDPSLDEFVYSTPITGAPYFPQEVDFSASDSFVVDVTGCVVQCLGGSCPLQTQNSPVSCPGGPVAKLTVNNAPTGTPSYAGLFFDWRFWDNDWNEPWTANEGNAVNRGFVFYDDISNSVNDKHMSVLVTHIATGANANFQRDFTLGLCLNGGNTFYSSGNPLSTSIPNNACKGGDLTEGTADDCCPAGLQCLDSSGSGTYGCEIPGGTIVTRCEEYATQLSCNSNTNPAIPLASYGLQPIPICTFLQCYWTNAGACGVRATQYQTTPTGCNIVSCPVSDCAWTTAQTECVNGRKTITYTGSSTQIPGCGPYTCDKPPVTVPCGSLNFELSFFGKIQFVITLIVIAALYFAFSFYRGKKHAKKN